jgi:hypothetical protein
LKNPNVKVLLRNFVLEMLIYSLLVILYVYLALRLLAEPLHWLFENNRVVYAFLGLILIVAQAVLLEAITGFIINQLQLERFD